MLSNILDYFYGSSIDVQPPTKIKTPVPVFLVTTEELLKVNLTPIKDFKHKPCAARNLPHISREELANLGGITLQHIQSVKLKKIIRPLKKTTWIPAHPVLREIHLTIKKIK